MSATCLQWRYNIDIDVNHMSGICWSYVRHMFDIDVVFTFKQIGGSEDDIRVSGARRMVVFRKHCRGSEGNLKGSQAPGEKEGFKRHSRGQARYSSEGKHKRVSGARRKGRAQKTRKGCAR